MTISFENDNDVIVYTLERIISFARDNQYIFFAQSVWWISSIIGLQPGLITNNDDLQSHSKKEQIQCEVTITLKDEVPESKERRLDTILKKCEEFLRDSKRLRDIANLKSTGRTKSGRNNPRKSTKQALKESGKRKDYPRTEGIEPDEIFRRKAAGECLGCAWPPDRKGTHSVKDCIRPIKLEKGTASYPKVRCYQQQEPLRLDQSSYESSIEEDSSSEE